MIEYNQNKHQDADEFAYIKKKKPDFKRIARQEKSYFPVIKVKERNSTAKSDQFLEIFEDWVNLFFGKKIEADIAEETKQNNQPMIYETPTKLIILDNEEKAARINYVKNKIGMMKNLCDMQNRELVKVEIGIDRLAEASMN